MIINNEFNSNMIQTAKNLGTAMEFINAEPTEEMKRADKKLNDFTSKYNIPVLLTEDDNNYLYDFEEEALEYVFLGQEVPPELIKKLEDTMEVRKERNRRNGWSD